MRSVIIPLIFASLLLACTSKPEPAKRGDLKLNGTWQLITGTTITKGVRTITDYTKDQQFLKIINNSHFAFLKHGLHLAKDSSNKFDAGGGAYTLKGDQYTEHLDFYSDKNWEGKSFNFKVTIKDDTLTQTGIEKVEKENIDRTIIEKYVRLK